MKAYSMIMTKQMMGMTLKLFHWLVSQVLVMQIISSRLQFLSRIRRWNQLKRRWEGLEETRNSIQNILEIFYFDGDCHPSIYFSVPVTLLQNLLLLGSNNKHRKKGYVSLNLVWNNLKQHVKMTDLNWHMPWKEYTI